MSTRIAIAILTRNRRAFLEEALNSALSQNANEPFEVVVIDNASSDETAEYLGAVSSESLRVVRSEENLGEAGGRNLAIESTDAEFVLWLDDDDALTDEALSSHLACLEANPDAEIIYGNLYRCDEQLETLDEWKYRPYKPEQILPTALYYSPFPNGGTMIKRSLFDRVGNYDSDFKRGPDYEFWLRAALGNAIFVHNDTFIYRYRGHEENYYQGEEHPEFNLYNVKVVDRLFQLAPREKIFPELDWTGNTVQAEAIADARRAMVLARYQAFERAREILSACEKRTNARDIKVLLAMLLRKQGALKEASDKLAEAALSNNKGLIELLTLGRLL